MTKAYLNAGICGYTVSIIVERLDKTHLNIMLDTDCEMVKAMQNDLKSQEWRKLLKKISDSPVYISASRRVKHTGCPVPMAIIKAIEVELGISIPKEVGLTFGK